MKKISRADSPEDRLAWVNNWVCVPEGAKPVTGVQIDGEEDTSAIVLLRPGAKDIIIPGARALRDPRAVEAIAGAALRVAIPTRTRELMGDFADIVYSLADVQNIYDSVAAATDWCRSYLYLAGDPRLDLSDWDRFDALKKKEQDARAMDTHPAPEVVPHTDGALLVVRPWFHRHVQHDLGHNGLSEQRIATLVARAGWKSLPTARSSRTVHHPKNNKWTIQFRFYVVPDGWLEALSTEDPPDA